MTFEIEIEIEIPKQTRVTPQKSCHLIRKPQDPVCLPGGHFASGITKIYRLQPIHTGNVLLNFRYDIQSQTKVSPETIKKPIWPAGGRFESDVAENQLNVCLWPQSTFIWNLKLKKIKANLTYAPETMSPTDGRTDKSIPVYPPPTSLGEGITKLHVKPWKDMAKYTTDAAHSK